MASLIKDGLVRLSPDIEIFYSPESLGAGLWLPKLAEEIAGSDAFLLLIGTQGLGPWQQMEYNTALDRHVNDALFVLLPVIAAGAQVPGLSFLRQLNWIEAPDPASDLVLRKVMSGLEGRGSKPATPLWQLVNPYRGLESLAEEDADYFCGRSAETAALLDALATGRGSIPILIGASGVGKSSVARAGALAALKRMRWPGSDDAGQDVREWPRQLAESRRWAMFTMRPGTDPIEALVRAFTGLWSLQTSDPEAAALPRRWARGLASGDNTIADLLDSTQAQLRTATGTAPDRFLIYLDQLEELYTKTSEPVARRFSALVKQALADDRLQVFGSLRVDYFGSLQADTDFLTSCMQINVAPLDRARIREVITMPAEKLGATFENPDLPDRITAAALRSASTLPLLSYLLTDAWRKMAGRSDGVLRLESQAIDVGSVLTTRAEEFLASQPGLENSVRQLLTLKLANVPPEGEPLRREVSREECSEELWRLACVMADAPWRLVVIRRRELDDLVTAEVGHEALLRSWPRLSQWLADERDFLVFRSEVERREREWRRLDRSERGLLTGLDLARAKEFVPQRGSDLSGEVRTYAALSIRAERDRARRGVRRAVAAALVMAMLAVVAVTAATYAYISRGEARTALSDAQRTESLRLSELAEQSRVAGDLGTALLLELAALPDEGGGSPRPIVPEAELGLSQALAGLRETAVYPHSAPVLRVAADPSGRRFATASETLATVWTFDGSAAPRALDHPSTIVRAVAFSRDGSRVASASDDGRVRVFDAVTGKQVAEVKLAGAGLDVLFGVDGRTIVTASSDGTVQVWDIARSSLMFASAVQDSAVVRVALDGAGRMLATATADGRVAIRSAVDLSVVHGLEAVEPQAVTALAFDGEGRRLLAAYEGGKLQVWEVESGRPAGDAIAPGAGEIHGAAFDTSGERIVVAQESAILVWDLNDGAPVGAPLRGHGKLIRSLALVPGHDEILTGSDDGTARLWREAAPVLGERSLPHERGVRAIGWSRDGQRIVTGSDDFRTRIWDVATGAPIGIPFGDHAQPVYSASFDRDGSRVLTASTDGTASIRNLATGEVKALPAGEHGTETASFSPDGTLIAVGAEDGRVRIFDAATGQLVHPPLTGHSGPVRYVAFSPDGAVVFSASTDQTLRAWDVKRGRQIGRSATQSAPIRSVNVSPDGTLVVAALRDGRVNILSASLSTTIGTFFEDAPVRLAIFSPDGRWIATATEDNRVNLRLGIAGAAIRAPVRVDAVLATIRFSPDGRVLAVGSSDRRVRLWPLPSVRDMVENAQKAAPRCLTKSQRRRYFLAPEPEPWCAGKWSG